MAAQQLVEKTAQISGFLCQSAASLLTTITLLNPAFSQTLDKELHVQLKNSKVCDPQELVRQRKNEARVCQKRLNINESDMTKVDTKLADKFGECLLEEMSDTCSKQ